MTLMTFPSSDTHHDIYWNPYWCPFHDGRLRDTLVCLGYLLFIEWKLVSLSPTVDVYSCHNLERLLGMVDWNSHIYIGNIESEHRSMNTCR
jgi:hypothetical protein